MTQIALEKRYSSARQALDALESKQIQPSSPTKPPTRRKILKPSGTRIKLYTSTEDLKVCIPAPGFRNLEKIGCFGLFIFLLLGLMLVSTGIKILKSALAQSSLFLLGMGLLSWLALLIPFVICLAIF